MTLSGMSSDPHNGVNSLDLSLMRLLRQMLLGTGIVLFCMMMSAMLTNAFQDSENDISMITSLLVSYRSIIASIGC